MTRFSWINIFKTVYNQHIHIGTVIFSKGTCCTTFGGVLKSLCWWASSHSLWKICWKEKRAHFWRNISHSLVESGIFPWSEIIQNFDFWSVAAPGLFSRGSIININYTKF